MEFIINDFYVCVVICECFKNIFWYLQFLEDFLEILEIRMNMQNLSFLCDANLYTLQYQPYREYNNPENN